MSKAKSAAAKAAPAKAPRVASKLDVRKLLVQFAFVAAAALAGGVWYSTRTPVCAGASRHNWKPSMVG